MCNVSHEGVLAHLALEELLQAVRVMGSVPNEHLVLETEVELQALTGCLAWNHKMVTQPSGKAIVIAP